MLMYSDDVWADDVDLTALMTAVDRFRARPQRSAPAGVMAEELTLLRRTIALLELDFSVRAAAFAATNEYDEQGACSPISWVKHNCQMTGTNAARAIRVGDQADGLPLSTAAMAEGRIGFDHLGLMASVAEAVNASPTAAPFDERPLLRMAEKHLVKRFRNDCAHVRHAIDAEAFLNEHVEAVEARRLEMSPCDDGSLFLRGNLDPVGGATVRTALEALARPGGVGDTRDRERRLADALVELAGHGLDEGVVPERAGQRVHLQVTASVETLVGMTGAPAGEMDLSSPIPTATVQRLACDAEITRVVLGPDSEVIDVGRTRRLPSAAMRRGLNARDRGCVWPGCDRPPSWTQAHHLEHWTAHNGPTDMANLVLICNRHHMMVHEGGWVLTRSPDGGMLAVPPIARHYVAQARAPDDTGSA